MTRSSLRVGHLFFSLPIFLALACGDEAVPPPVTALNITTDMLPMGRAGEAYAAMLVAAGGSGDSFTWTITAGALPDGLTLASSGKNANISGTPTGPGEYSITFQVKDVRGDSSARSYLLRIEMLQVEPLEISPDSLPDGIVGEEYSAVLTASGGSEVVFGLFSGGLPPGLTLSTTGEGGLIAGTPASAGTFTFIVQAEASSGERATHSYALEIVAAPVPLELLTSSLPNGTIGEEYSAELMARGGRGALRWSIAGGVLPAGLTLDAAGELAGVPAEVVTATVTMRVEDEDAAFVERAFTLEIARNGAELRIIPSGLDPGRVGDSYSQNIRATGGVTTVGYTWSIVQGALPPGLVIVSPATPSTSINGTPTAAGDFAFVVEVVDSVGQRGTLAMTIQVEPAIVPVQITTTTLPDGVVNAVYSAQVSAQDGAAGNYNWIVSAGALPQGLVLGASGRPSTSITGTPVQAGTFTATITVFDQNNATDTQVLSVTIAPPAVPLSIITVSLPNAGFSVPYSEQITAAAGSGVGFQWSVTGGALPPGLSLDAAGTPSTRLRGAPTAPGEYSFTVQVVDSAGGLADRNYQVIVGEALSIDTLSLPNATLSQVYAATLSATGGSGVGFVWSVAQGVLPPGLVLAPSGTPSTTLTGTIAALGTFDFELEVRDSNNQVARQTYQIRVNGERRYAAWVGDTMVDGDTEVFVVDVLSSPVGVPVRLNPVLPAGNAATSANYTQFSPDNSKIAFRGDFTAAGILDLYVVDLTAPVLTAIKVSGPLGANQGVGEFGWSPDSLWLTYQADQDTVDVLEQYVVDMSGSIPGLPQKINDQPVLGGDVGIEDWRFSPDSKKIIYLADEVIDNMFDLFFVDLSSGLPTEPVRVNGPLDPLNADVNAVAMQFTPDSNAVIYTADETTIDVNELYWVDITATPPFVQIKLNIPPVADGDVTDSDVAISPDGAWLSYIGDVEVDLLTELFLVDLRGAQPAAPVKVSAPQVLAGDVFSASWSPDGTRIMYCADQFIDGVNELFVIDVASGTPSLPVKISAPLPAFGSISNIVPTGYTWSPDGNWVGYRADTLVDTAMDLVVVPMNGAIPGLPARLNPQLAAAADIDQFGFSPDSSRLFFRGDTAVLNRVDLYYLDLLNGTPGPAMPVAVPSIAAGAVGDTKWFGNDRLYFVGDLTVDAVTNAYLVDLTGAPRLLLNTGSPAAGDVNTIFAPY